MVGAQLATGVILLHVCFVFAPSVTYTTARLIALLSLTFCSTGVSRHTSHRMMLRVGRPMPPEFLIRALEAESAASGMFWHPAMVHEGVQQRRAEHVAFFALCQRASNSSASGRHVDRPRTFFALHQDGCNVGFFWS